VNSIADNIRAAICNDRYVFSVHANQKLRKRRIMAWQVVEGMAVATLLRERADADPNPVAEFDQVLPDGTAVKTVWAWISHLGVAKLVTVHCYDW